MAKKKAKKKNCKGKSCRTVSKKGVTALKKVNTLAKKIRKGTNMKWSTALKKAGVEYRKNKK